MITEPARLGGAFVARRGARSAAFLAAILVSWEVIGRSRPILMSSPSSVFNALTDRGFMLEQLLPALAQTLIGLAIGFAIAVVVGSTIGYLMGASRWVEAILEPYVTALYSTPRITLIPLLILWAGIGMELRIVVVALSSLFPIAVNTHRGARDIPSLYADVAAFSCATPWQRWRTLTLPWSVPYLVAGLKVGILRALTAAIVAEMVAALTGTGKLLLETGRFLQTERLFAALIVLGAVGIVLGAAIDGLRWILGRARLA